jgi:hypothetical protein
MYDPYGQPEVLDADAVTGPAERTRACPKRGAIAFCGTVLMLAWLAAATADESPDAVRAEEASPVPLTDRWTVRFRFIGVPEEEVWVFYDPDAPLPDTPIDVREFVRFEIRDVLVGDPPTDPEGMYRYVSLGAGAKVLPYGSRIPGLCYEVTGLWRKDPESGAVLFKDHVRELWARWFCQVAGYAIGIGASVIAVIFVGRRLAKRLFVG